MTEDQSFSIVVIGCAIIWFIGSIVACIISHKERDREEFRIAFMAIFASPVAILPISLILFGLILAFFFDWLPGKLFGRED